jgi:hypothetical protein
VSAKRGSFWPSVVRRWALALGFALASAAAAGAGYAYVAKPYEAELRVLRARVAFTESIEDRILTMTRGATSVRRAIKAQCSEALS